MCNCICVCKFVWTCKWTCQCKLTCVYEHHSKCTCKCLWNADATVIVNSSWYGYANIIVDVYVKWKWNFNCVCACPECNRQFESTCECHCKCKRTGRGQCVCLCSCTCSCEWKCSCECKCIWTCTCSWKCTCKLYMSLACACICIIRKFLFKFACTCRCKFQLTEFLPFRKAAHWHDVAHYKDGVGRVGWGTNVCLHTREPCFFTGRSLALAHTRHATLLDVPLHLHNRIMLRYWTFSCTSTHLLRNILSNYWCGMHLTCKNNSVNLTGKIRRFKVSNLGDDFSLSLPEVLWVLMQLKSQWKKEKLFHLFRLRKPCKTGNQFVESGMVVFGLATSHSQEMKQVRMADQAMYHQGNQSVFVGGRLWTLLPPPACNSQ